MVPYRVVVSEVEATTSARKLLRITGCLLAAVIDGCGGGGGSTPADVGTPTNNPLPPPTVELMAAEASSAYASVLVKCALAESASESCTLAELPLLGQETSDPDIDDVLARTVISHAWMKTRFREVLEVLPRNILTLMKGVTVVVIASDVNPSFYSPTSGAIFLDPYFLWLTNPEKATVSKDADYRAGFGSELAFVSLARYVSGSSYAWNYYDLNDSQTRSIHDIDRAMASLLFHELTHANDAFPPAEIVNLDMSISAYAAVEYLKDRRISEQLSAHQPLNSQMWMDLAQVMYQGDPASTEQQTLNAAQVGLEFESDGASDDYAYSGNWEDLAMLVEEVLMHYHYGVHREIAYTNSPPIGEERYCDSYVVRWGVRNRIGDALVRARAEFGLQLLLNNADISVYIATLPTQWRMVNGRDWCSIQDRGTAASAKPAGTSATLETTTLRPRLRRDDRSARYR